MWDTRTKQNKEAENSSMKSPHPEKVEGCYSQEHQTVTSIIESIKEKAIMAVNWV